MQYVTKGLFEKALCLGLFFLGFQPAHASYFIIKGQDLGVTARTHVFITDRSKDLGNAPRYSALSKAKRVAELYPQEQILFIIPQKDAYDDGLFKKAGFTTIETSKKTLDPAELTRILKPYKKIASLHTFGHSAVSKGVFLDVVGKTSVSWLPSHTVVASLQPNFTDDAFATLNGCNGAHIMAPKLSKMWNIPVSGAMTGTHFEGLFPDNQYYLAHSRNTELFLPNITTHFRMKPDNGNYHGHYGEYFQGLPFYKFFCADVAPRKCLKAMAQSVLLNPINVNTTTKPDYALYAHAVRQWLCPATTWGAGSNNCNEVLAQINPQALRPGELNYTPFLGVMAQCDFNSCYPVPTCQSSAESAYRCAKTYKPERGTSDTFVKEYIYYLQGFQLLNP